ncbi:peptide transporter (plasmid) [Vibrio alfacsensis]|nr:peptide transporter [Vibrio alfacsensis]
MRGSKTGSINARSGLSLNNGKPLTKQYKFGDRYYTARHVIIKAEDVEENTISHSLNIRAQVSLTLDAVRDIYPEVVADGIKQEGLAYLNPQTQKYELIDGSRRRFCAIEAKCDLPLWVLDFSPTPYDIKAYVDLSQKVKKFSWREEGLSFIKFADEQGINPDDIDAIGAALGKSRETIRKKINAANLNADLIGSIPDSEGIPTKFYASLGKIEKTLAKNELAIMDFLQQANESFVTDNDDIADVQTDLLRHYESLLETLINKPKKNEARVEPLAQFSSKNKFARLNVSGDGRKAKFEFGYMSKSTIDEIENFVRELLKKEEK